MALARVNSPLCVAVLCWICLPVTAQAQLYTVRPGVGSGRNPAAERDKTEISVELLMDNNAGALHAQEWNRVFQQLNVPVRMRRSLLNEKPNVSEQQVGTLRFVKVVGQLDRSGDLVFADRRFSRSEAAKLGEWLRELQTFGAQGNPEGQPLWGLTKTQFGELYAALGEPLGKEIEGLSLSGALARFELPQRYSVRYTAAAREWLQKGSSLPETVRQEVEGFTKGTALAITLNNLGLGFRPLRTPVGGIELAIEPLEGSAVLWPIGWELKNLRTETAPRLFEMVPVELEDVRLVDVLHAVSVKTEIPVVYDDYRIAKYKIDLENLKVSYPARRTAWFIVLRGVTNPARLSHELRIDERGRPFLWISTLKIGEFGR